MSSGSNQRVFTGSNVLLAGQTNPQPATIVVDITTGKITDIQSGRRARQDFPATEVTHWLDAGERLILPGLVE